MQERISAIPLLYVYTKKDQLKEPVNDYLTKCMEKLFAKHYQEKYRGSLCANYTFWTKTGTLGVHKCSCQKEQSESVDYLIPIETNYFISPKKCTKKELLEYLGSFGLKFSGKTTKKELLEFFPLKFATNTLCVHYLRYHREEIPDEELNKVKFLYDLFSRSTERGF